MYTFVSGLSINRLNNLRGAKNDYYFQMTLEFAKNKFFGSYTFLYMRVRVACCVLCSAFVCFSHGHIATKDSIARYTDVECIV